MAKHSVKKSKRDLENEPNVEVASSHSDSAEDLVGFSSDDDSSETDEPGQGNIKQTKTITKRTQTQVGNHTVSKSLQRRTVVASKGLRGVVYIGRIPHGFYEDEMRNYFTQFGDITRLRLSRNKHTGKSKHYGFIEFRDRDVARIAADTMDNYLLFGHLLRVRLLDDAAVHDDLFIGADSRYKVLPRHRLSQRAHDGPRSQEKWEKLSQKWAKNKAQKQRKLADKGISFDLSSI